ncbi:MAG: sensor histidine kinase [Magnetococcales bacterium]|nr:sensor histidine kinase [Magnetococcales bacterium]
MSMVRAINSVAPINHKVRWWNSVGIALFRSVFLFYCVITIMVTLASLYAEYSKTKDSVNFQLIRLQEGFERTLVYGVWEMDQNQIRSALFGMSKNPIISGISIIDTNGKVIGRTGLLPINEINRQILHTFLTIKETMTTRATPADQPLSLYSFNLTMPKKNSEQIGQVRLFWNQNIIFDEVRYEFMVLILGAIVKTIALWIIFILFQRPILTTPLGVLTRFINGLNESNLACSHVAIHTKQYNEFNLLVDHVNDMILKVSTAYDEIAAKSTELKQEIVIRERAELKAVASEKLVHQLISHIQTVQEDEKKYIAKEIHDELGSLLTKIKMDISSLQKYPPEYKEETNERLVKISGLVEQINENIRRIARSLRPKVLDEFGLTAALEWLIRDMNHHCRIGCRWSCIPHEVELSDIYRTTLFRICQEALNNVAKHAGAQKTIITLREEESTVILEIEDDGCGIDMERLNNQESFGIEGMRERARQLKGELGFELREEGGTRMWVHIPLLSIEDSKIE